MHVSNWVCLTNDDRSCDGHISHTKWSKMLFLSLLMYYPTGVFQVIFVWDSYPTTIQGFPAQSRDSHNLSKNV